MIGLPRPRRVLDASALMAYVWLEPGADAVEIEGSAVSAVNWAEVGQKFASRGQDLSRWRSSFAAVGFDVIPFTETSAEAAAALWARTRALGLSLGDRACLALAAEFGVPAVTADRAWAGLDVGVEVVVVR
jgi:ribonuclease VapC